MTQEITYRDFGKDPGRVMGVLLPLAAVSPHLYEAGIGRFYHSVANAVAAGTYTVQQAQVGDSPAVTGFAVWGRLNQVVAARFRCAPDSLRVDDYTSGDQPILIAFASPLSPELDRHLRAHLRATYPDMTVPEL